MWFSSSLRNHCFFLNLQQDINDELPTFRGNQYVGEINENSQKGTPVTFRIK